MNETKLFLMPDYFPRFTCKMGACRTVCCSGWQVSITLDNYFALLGTDCSMELRRKMDCALKPVDYPDDGKYAVIQPNYFGQCPLRLEDGRCGVQTELGEDILPDICRLYPRGVRCHGDHFEISLANSCEAVPEMFLHREEPISFFEREWTMKLPPLPSEEMGAWKVRKDFIDKVQDRSVLLPCRLASLGEIIVSEISEKTLVSMMEVLKELCEHSDSIRPYGEKTLAYLQSGDVMEKYLAAKEHFKNILPDWQTFFEHLLVNHMFFTRYPFSERNLCSEEKFASLVMVYALVRLVSVGYMAESEKEEELADAVAAAFRLISHTDFDRTALYMLYKHLEKKDISHLLDM